jgi:hypothetical protein
VKYIIMQTLVRSPNDQQREFPIIFPEALTHAVVAAALERHCPELRGGKPVAAGFLSSLTCASPLKDGGACWGDSESLKLKSRGTIDDALINMLDYNHGILL